MEFCFIIKVMNIKGYYWNKEYINMLYYDLIKCGYYYNGKYFWWSNRIRKFIKFF